MQALADAGAPMDAIVIALRALEEKDAEIAARDAVAAERRAKDAERKRIVRGQSVDVPRTVPDPNKEIPPIPPKEINPSTPVISNEITSPAVLELVSDNSDPAKPKLQPTHVAEAWNAMCDRCGLPKVRTIEGPRDRKLRSLIRKHPIEEFTEAIDAVERARWMHGENARGWRVNFKFFLDHFTEFLEGTYDKSAA